MRSRTLGGIVMGTKSPAREEPRQVARVGLPGGADLGKAGRHRHAEEARDGVEHRRMPQKVEVPAVLDHDHPAASVCGRRHDRVVRGEDRELSCRSSLRVVRRAEGDEPADAAPVAELDEVAGDETAEAVADDVYPRGARVPADLLDPPGEPGDEALVVDAGRVREAREVPDATARE